MISRQDLIAWCDNTLQSNQFKDYAPNGLQVEGTNHIESIVTAVSASRAAIDFACQQHADALLVHHGMFWKNEPITITGWKRARIATLLNHNINLIGYHLPLDAHPILGNNAQLATQLGWQTEQTFGEQNLINIGTLPENQQSLPQLLVQLENILQRKPLAVGNVSGSIKRIAWCTGGAQSFFQEAINMGVDVYITGEISEPQYHLANETGIIFISAGHHATERYGIGALGEKIASNFNIKHQFFDEPNPV